MGAGISFEERLRVCDAGPDLLELMDYVRLTKSQKTTFLKLFQKVDKDGSGFISVMEFLVAMGLDHSTFIEKCFNRMDINNEGDSNLQLDVTEFFIGLFNFCFLPSETLSKFMFDLYDDDHNGGITRVELAEMVADVCGSGKEHIVDKLMHLLDGDGSLDVSYTEFMKVEKRAGTILQPVFSLQKKLQNACMGSRFWRSKRKFVKELLERNKVETLVDYFAAMISKTMPPAPTVDGDDDDDDQDASEPEEREKTFEELEAERLEAERQALIDEYSQKEVFKVEFEEFRKMRDPNSGRDYWVNTKTKEELWTLPYPGAVITSGQFVRALDFTYERAYWWHKQTRERIWTLPTLNSAKAKKYTADALSLRRQRGFPEPPKHVSAAGGQGRAAVWWTRPVEHEKFKITKVALLRYRLDKTENPADPEWLYKGRDYLTDKDSNDGTIPVSFNVRELNINSTYKFSVITYNSIGESEESEYSNEVEIMAPLPEGWLKYDLPDGRIFFANNKTREVSWKRPDDDPFFLETSLFMKFSRSEIKRMKDLYSLLDWDQSEKISVNEFKEILIELGDDAFVDNEARFKWLWRMVKKDEFGEVGFAAVMQLLEDLRNWKLSQRSCIVRYACCICEWYARRRNGGVKIASNVLTDDPGLKMGNWVKIVHPVVGRPFYHNKVSQITTWDMPPEIRFYISDKLNDELRRNYSAEQIEAFQKEFQAMDLDGSGAIDEVELGMILENLGEKITPARLKGLIREVDKDRSGEVEYEEFIAMLDAVYRGKGSHGWSRVNDTAGSNKQKLEVMKENLDEYKEEYEKKQLDLARKKGIRFPHGKCCYCGCRRPLNRPPLDVSKKAAAKANAS